MATITRVHGNAAPFEAIGRDIEWVLINVSTWVSGDFTTTPNDPGSNLEAVTKAMSVFSTITIQGLATANDIIYGLEGLGLDIDLIEIELEALPEVTAANATSVIISGVTFA